MVQEIIRPSSLTKRIIATSRVEQRSMAIFGLVLAAGAWGVSFVVTRGAVASYPVGGFLFLRFAVGGGVLAVAALVSPSTRSNWRAAPRRRLLFLGVVLAVAYLAQTVGLELGATPAVAAVLTSLAVVITPALEWGIGRRTPDMRVVAAASLALAGTLLVCLAVPSPSTPLPGHAALGMVLEVAAAIAFSLQVVLVGQLGHRVPAIALGAWQLLALATVLGVALPFTGGLAPLSPSVLMAVVFCGLAASAFAFAVQAAAQQHISSSTAALIMAIEPGIAMVGGAVAGIQAITPLALLGLVLLSSGSAAYGGRSALGLLRRLVMPLGRLARST